MRGVNETLEAVAKLLQQRGWIQGKMNTERGYCLVGALWVVGDGDGAFPDEAALTIKQYLELKEDVAAVALVRWNDNCYRTGKEVIAMLYACAAVKEEELCEA